MPQSYPLQLSCVLKERIWAGKTLPTHWGKGDLSRPIGESWELSVRKGEMCRIQNGPLAGEALGDRIARDASILGRTQAVEDFPLLIKLIDAGDSLSVQVHPDDAYAARVEKDRGKTEMWYIVDAAPGAELILGLTENTTAEEFSRAVERGAFEHLLCRVPVTAGECYFIPAGLPHAIGAGILIAEIQQNSDLTYRVYDFDRRDANGNLRELHVQKALDVIQPFTKEEMDAVRFSNSGGVPKDNDTLADNAYFSVFRRTVQGSLHLDASASARHLLCLEGEAEIRCEQASYRIARGDSYLLPASLPACDVVGNCLLLESRIP